MNFLSMPTSESFFNGEEQWLLENYPREVLKDKSYEELNSLLPYPERDFGHIMGAFVIELMSISFSNVDDGDDNMYGIYGTIRLVDGEGATFDLYDRQHDNHETISNGGFLTITLPMDHAITATGLAKLHVDLKDSNKNGVEIVKGVFDWDCTVKDHHCDGVHHTELFQGEGGSVVVDFVSYHHAVVCIVDVKFLKDCSGVNVYGEIVARYDGKFSTVLFDKKQNDSISVNSGTNIQLSRRVVIAPTLSPSFNIHVNLFNGDNHENIVEETIQFGIWGTSAVKRYDGPSGLIEAQVQWGHPLMQPHFAEVAPINNSISLFPYGPKLLEIYSVSIAGHMAEGMDVWGSIKLWIPGVKFILFNEDKSSPQKLLPGQIVPLPSHTNRLLSVCGAFGISLELRDVGDRSISMGRLGWDERTCAYYMKLLDRQVCSVVRSVNGYYAAVHYSLFCIGIEAMVKIYLNDKSLNMKYFKVDGSVCAQYSGYNYSTAYQREYYRRKLFVRKSSEPLLSYLCSSLLLSESSVMVPKGCALMVDVSLDVISSEALSTLGVVGNGGGDSSFLQLVEFNNDNINREEIFRKEIDRSSLQLVIQVEWRKLF